jgi:UDP-N-acetyl-D-glucosamine dehydrogenase
MHINFNSTLFNKINKKTAKIAIIGLGYVGLPLALQFSKKKFEVFGIDIDKNKIKLLEKEKSYIKHIDSKTISKNKSIIFTTKFKTISKVDIILLCLPTPLSKTNNPDLSYIKNTMRNIQKYLHKGQLIVLESSTYPGSTKKTLLPYLRKKFSIGYDFFLGYSPEREDPNNKKFNLENIPKICSGYTNNCLRLSKKLYEKIIKSVIKVSSIETAEFIKLYENIYRSVNIGLINELKTVSYKLNLDIYEIINAAKTKPFGFQAFYPGPGVGGHCIPVDPYYLSWIAKENKVKTNLIFHAGKINSQMPNWIISKILLKKKIKKVLLIGAAYKKGLDDTRESPTIDFIRILKKKKIQTEYHDPNVKYLKSRKLNKTYVSKKLNKDILKKYDCVIILTDHININYNLIKENANFIVDTRNIYKNKSNEILKL